MKENNERSNDSEEWWDEELSKEWRAAADKFLTEAGALVRKVRAGEMTEEQAEDQIAGMLDGDRMRAGNFLLHALHQDELNKLRDEQGIIID